MEKNSKNLAYIIYKCFFLLNTNVFFKIKENYNINYEYRKSK